MAYDASFSCVSTPLRSKASVWPEFAWKPCRHIQCLEVIIVQLGNDGLWFYDDKFMNITAGESVRSSQPWMQAELHIAILIIHLGLRGLDWKCSVNFNFSASREDERPLLRSQNLSKKHDHCSYARKTFTGSLLGFPFHQCVIQVVRPQRPACRKFIR